MGNPIAILLIVNLAGVFLGVIALIIGIFISDALLIALGIVVLVMSLGTIPLVRWLSSNTDEGGNIPD